MIAHHEAGPAGAHGYDMTLARRARATAARLLLFQGVLAGQCGQALLELLDLLESDLVGVSGAVAVAEAYGRLFRGLATVTNAAAAPAGQDEEVAPNLLPPAEPNAWRAYLVARLLQDDNPFTGAAQAAAAQGAPGIAPALRQAAVHDLRLLGELASLDGEALAAAVGHVQGDSPPGWTHLRQPAQAAPMGDGDTERLTGQLLASADWAECVDTLAAFVARHGSGPLAGHRALRWTRGAGGPGRLTPVTAPDPITPDDLIGYDEPRRMLAHNTERFLAGLPANDVLLFGARGTGKSSSVKSLLAAYGERGLRLVEVPRDALHDLGAVCAALRGRPGAYILFIDDLSFEEQETDYKGLKAVLEGQLEARPTNVRVYATSNRRHLVREQFSDRARPGAETDAEVRPGDTAQEKLSLADRFGLVLIFTAPDQVRYLQIVEGIAHRRGLSLPAAELRAQALRWAEWHNGRSGRTARQFVDSLVGGPPLRDG